MNLSFAWVREHPYAAGAVVLIGGVILYLMIRGRQGATPSGVGSTIDPTLANLEAAANAQQTQQNGQIQIANIQANVANNQTQAQLAAYKDNDATQVQLATITAKQATDTAGIQADILKTMFTTARDEQVSNNTLAQYDLSQRYALAQSGVQLAKQGNRAQAGTNVVATALGQGDISSYNQSVASKDIASSLANAQIFSALLNGGSNIAKGLFAL